MKIPEQRFLRALYAICISAILITSCKKDDPQPPGTPPANTGAPAVIHQSLVNREQGCVLDELRYYTPSDTINYAGKRKYTYDAHDRIASIKYYGREASGSPLQSTDEYSYSDNQYTITSKDASGSVNWSMAIQLNSSGQLHPLAEWNASLHL